MRLPDKGGETTLEHGGGRSGKSANSAKQLWEGVIAPGEGLPLAFALCVCSGAAIYLRLPFEPGRYLILVLFSCVALSLIAIWRHWLWGVVRIGTILLIGIGLGFCAGKMRAALVAAPSITAPMGPIIVEGWVSAVEPAQKGVRLRIIPHAIAGLSQAETPGTIRLTHGLSLNVYPGRFVRCWAVLRPPPDPSIPGDYDFHRQAWFEGLGSVGYVQGRCRGGVLGAPETAGDALRLRLAALRRGLAEYTYRSSGSRAGGFAAALVSGDRSYMSSEDQEMLRASGLAHLLAISGLHLGIVGGLVYFLFRQGLAFIAPLSLRVPVQKPAAIAALLAITAYLVISGASVSTQRAFIMSAVFFSAILIDRPALSLRSFSLAMIAVVLIAPESVFAPGFQMSFAATGVLIAIYEAWSRRRAGKTTGLIGRGVFAGQSLVVTSVAASLATAPFALFHFERLAPLGLLANLAAMPVVSLLSVPAAGLAIILAPFGLSHYGLRLFGWSLERVLEIADWAVRLGEGLIYPIKQMPESALLAFIAALIGLIFFRRWLRLIIVALTSASGMLIWSISSVPLLYWAASGDVYLNLDESAYQVSSFAQGDALGPLGLRYAQPGKPCGEALCTYQSAQGVEILLAQSSNHEIPCAPKRVFLVIERSEGNAAACAHTVFWEDVDNLGGIEVRFSSDGLKVKHASKCSARPWRQCAVR